MEGTLDPNSRPGFSRPLRELCAGYNLASLHRHSDREGGGGLKSDLEIQPHISARNGIRNARIDLQYPCDETWGGTRIEDLRRVGSRVHAAVLIQNGRLAGSRCVQREDAGLRICQQITVSTPGEETVVPIAMKSVSAGAEFGHLLIGNFDPRRIDVAVEFAFHSQSGRGLGGGDEVDDDLVADQRFAAPVLADEGEQAVFDRNYSGGIPPGMPPEGSGQVGWVLPLKATRC